LERQITAATEKLRPTGDDGVAKALRTLQTGGLSLSASIAAKDMNTVYSYALSGLSNEALTTVCKKLVRGEYDIERKAFIPLPPELAAMVRAEQRVFSEDLSRLRGMSESIKLAKPEPKNEAMKARIRALVASSKPVKEAAE